MPYSVNLRSDNDSADAIRSMWVDCGALEKSPSMNGLNYPPHITLAVYDDIEIEKLFAAFDSAVVDLPRISARFERLGYFIAPHAVILWAAPTLPPTATSLHATLHGLINPELCRPHYRPGSWVPHCSLATTIDLSRTEEAIDVANRSIKPFDVVFDVADCASFMPVEVIHERELPQLDA